MNKIKINEYLEKLNILTKEGEWELSNYEKIVNHGRICFWIQDKKNTNYLHKLCTKDAWGFWYYRIYDDEKQIFRIETMIQKGFFSFENMIKQFVINNIHNIAAIELENKND